MKLTYGISLALLLTAAGSCKKAPARPPFPVTGETDSDDLDEDTDDESTSTSTSTASNSASSSTATSATTAGSVVGAYFVEWGVYGRAYEVDNIPWDKINHLIYSFIPICGTQDSLKAANPSGWDTLQKECATKQKFQITIHDKFAALEAPHNNFAKMAAQKLLHPNVKILPSIGGWTLSDAFFEMASTQANRAIFIKSCTDFLESYPFFDGIDIDWEYPGGGGASTTLGSASDKANHLALMSELRAALDTLGKSKNRTYLITSAVGAGPKNIAAVDYKGLYTNSSKPLIDLIFAMTYDYYGAWSGLRSHQTALYPREVALNTGFSASESITNLMNAGVPAANLVMGIASYGRGWQGVTSATPLSSSLTDLSGTAFALETGMWESGILDYKMIVSKFKGAQGWTASYDGVAKAPYLWSPTLKKLISYEDPCSVQAKMDFVSAKGLAGAFMWEIDSDNGDLIKVMNRTKPTNCL